MLELEGAEDSERMRKDRKRIRRYILGLAHRLGILWSILQDNGDRVHCGRFPAASSQLVTQMGFGCGLGGELRSWCGWECGCWYDERRGLRLGRRRGPWWSDERKRGVRHGLRLGRRRGWLWELRGWPAPAL